MIRLVGKLEQLTNYSYLIRNASLPKVADGADITRSDDDVEHCRFGKCECMYF